MRALLGVQILSFSCSFQQIIRKIIGFWELAPPPGENPGSATGMISVTKSFQTINCRNEFCFTTRVSQVNTPFTFFLNSDFT